MLLKDSLLGKPATGLILLLGAFAFPFFVKGYLIFQASQFFVFALALLGLNFLMGFGGQISLGHGAIYALGAYTVAILETKYQLGYVVGLPAALLVGIIIGIAIGVPALRLAGSYFTLCTLALAMAVPQLIRFFEEWTGGAMGLFISKPEFNFGIQLDGDKYVYLLCLIILIVSFLAVDFLLKRHFGKVLTAVRDNILVAESLGINVSREKILAFAISSGLTSLAGGLSVLVSGVAAPDTFNIFLSISFLIGAVVGGLASQSGAIFGAFFILFVPNFTLDINPALTSAIFGCTLVCLLYFAPKGISGLEHKLLSSLKKIIRSS